MPKARKPPPAAATKISPAPPAVEGETPPETTWAGVRAAEMEVEPEEATDVEPEEEEDPEEAENGADESEGNEEQAVSPGDGTAAAAESEKVVVKEGGDEDTGMVMVSEEGDDEVTGMEPEKKEDPNEAVEEDEEPEEAEVEEEPEEAEVGAEEDEGMEEEATKVSAEGATVDDTNEIPEEEPEESGDEGSHGDNNKDEGADQLSDGGDAGGCENSYAQNDELDPSSLALDPVSEGNDKDLEIFVGGLPKDCVEEDITMVFSQFGEIESIRTIKNPVTKKSRGIAFVRYVYTGAAKKALAEFKEGIEVKGKKVRVSAAIQDNNTLFLGNICKSWTKDQVLNTLKSIGIEEFEMSLPDGPDTGGRNRRFAYLKFAGHDSAEAAFQRLKKPDAIFGIDRSAKVSFARPPTESSEELLMKVKTVYLDHVPLSWDEKKIKTCCEGYGKIKKINLHRKLKKSKKKNVSFVEFSCRKSALACVEGINNTKIGGGEVKLVASLARPPRKIQLAEKNAKGGFRVNSGAASKDADKSEKKKDQKKEAIVKENSPHKLLKGDESKLTSQGHVEVPQTSNRSKGKRKAGKSKNTSVNERPSKKARKNSDARAAYAGQPARSMMHPVGPQYATSYQANPSVGATSRSIPNAHDLEPHAGYISLANRVPASRVQSTYVAAPYNIRQINGLPYEREIAAPQAPYSVYTSNPGDQGGFAHPYLPLPPPSSGSYHPGNGTYHPRRGYY